MSLCSTEGASFFKLNSQVPWQRGKRGANLLPDSLNQIFLNDFHLSNGAKFSPFAGYSMPINYSQGIIKEHLHTRKSVSVFDISHMGQILIPSSEDNCKELEKFIPLDLNNLKLHNSLYSFILNDKGGIIDDIIISKIIIDSLEYFFIVYNASRKNIDEEIVIKKTTDYLLLKDHSLLAIQGPLSSHVVSNFSKEINKMYFMQIDSFIYNNHSIIISRTGYTGEDGFELSIPNKIIQTFIDDLLNDNNILLCGLGSRDTLRLEAGLSLYGNELSENLTPVEANLTWAIAKSRLITGDFNGFETISNQIVNGTTQKRVGIQSKNKSILRSQMEIYNKYKKNIGKITSGGFSPTLNISIAIAYIDKFVSEKTDKLYCLIRNNFEEIELTKLPFVNHNYRR